MKFLTNRGFSLLLSLSCLVLTAADWPRFRGPHGSATSEDRNLPVTWSAKEGVIWKTKLPGAGSSSPITFGDRLFLTCYSGYGVEGEDPGKSENLQRHLLCVDRNDGHVIWKRDVKSKVPEDPPSFLPGANHGYASSTPATDGERVFVFFGKTGVLAFDFEGTQLWQKSVGSESDRMRWGSASSPILYNDSVIINASAESGALIALDKQTGNQVWEAKADGLRGSWSTPILVGNAGGTSQLVVNVPWEVWGLNPGTGKLIWYAEAGQQSPTCPSLVSQDGIVYAIGGRRGGASAIRTGGKDDVTKTNVLWSKQIGSYVTSPVIHNDHVYWVSDRGIACCLKADSGETVYEKRLPEAGQIYASVVVADEKLFVVTRWNGTFVLAASPKFEQLAHNDLAPDDSSFNASPAVSGSQLLLRSDRFLYCIGKK